jgi:hypothetical protein
MVGQRHLLLHLEAQFLRRVEAVVLLLLFWLLVRLQPLVTTAAVDLFGQTIFPLPMVPMAMVAIKVAHHSEVVLIQMSKLVEVVVEVALREQTRLLELAVMVVREPQALT